VRGSLIVLGALAIVAGFFVAAHVFLQPSNDRVWSTDQAVLPAAEIAGGSVTIRNIRNFTYRSTRDYVPAYYDRAFDLADVVSVDYVLEPFGGVGAAHTFLSFGLRNGEHVAISVEVRKEQGESFGPLLGLLNQYELMYVVADERDVIELRAIHRGDDIHVYPTTANAAQAQSLLVDMLERVNAVAARPEFYNTVTNNCAVNIARHINALSPGRIAWDWRLLFPKQSDAYAWELGFLDRDVPLAEARRRYLVNDAVRKFAGDPEFSARIRAGR
jgi:hypothetical protein